MSGFVLTCLDNSDKIRDKAYWLQWMIYKLRKPRSERTFGNHKVKWLYSTVHHWRGLVTNFLRLEVFPNSIKTATTTHLLDNGSMGECVRKSSCINSSCHQVQSWLYRWPRTVILSYFIGISEPSKEGSKQGINIQEIKNMYFVSIEF